MNRLDAPAAEEDLRWQRSPVVAARHREAVRTRVEDSHFGDVLLWKVVHAEVVRALADRTDDTERRHARALFEHDGDNAVPGLIQRRTHQVVHPRVDHHPSSRRIAGGDLTLDHACEQHRVRTDERAARLAVERQVAEPLLTLRRPGGTNEVGRSNGASVTVVDPEAAAGVDELEAEPSAKRLRRLEDGARRGHVAVDRRQLRARVRRHADEADSGFRRVECRNRIDEARQGYPELRLVVARRDVAVCADFLDVDTWIDPQRHTRDASLRRSSSRDASDLFHALDVDRADAGVPDADREVELLIRLRDTAVDEAFGRDAAPHRKEELRTADDICAAACADEGANDWPGAVGFHGVSDEMRRALEGPLELTGLGDHSVKVIDVARRSDRSAAIAAITDRLPRQSGERNSTERELPSCHACHSRAR